MLSEAIDLKGLKISKYKKTNNKIMWQECGIGGVAENDIIEAVCNASIKN